MEEGWIWEQGRRYLNWGSHFRVSKRFGSGGVPRGPQEWPQLGPGQWRRGCLNWPCPVVRLITILNIAIEPSFRRGWRHWQKLEHWTELPKSSWRMEGGRIWARKSGPWEVHPLRQYAWANGSSPNPAGLVMKVHGIKLVLLNVVDNCGRLRGQWQWHWGLSLLHVLVLWDTIIFEYLHCTAWIYWGGPWKSHRPWCLAHS